MLIYVDNNSALEFLIFFSEFKIFEKQGPSILITCIFFFCIIFFLLDLFCWFLLLTLTVQVLEFQRAEFGSMEITK